MPVSRQVGLSLRGISLTAGLGLFVSAGLAQPATPPRPGVFAVLPDTQFYSEQSALTANFNNQTSWLVSSRARLNLNYVAHLGDIVNGGSSDTQWARANAAMSTLDGVVPYLACLGNHDYAVTGDKDSGSEKYRSFFGPQRYAGQTHYLGSDAAGENHVGLFTSGGVQFLVFALEYRPDTADMAWAQGWINQYPNAAVLVATHEHVRDGSSTDGTGAGRSTAGNATFAGLIRPNGRVLLVVNGHFASGPLNADGEWKQTVLNAEQTNVSEILTDYQGWTNGGDGWLRYYVLDTHHGLIHARTYNATRNIFQLDANSTFSMPVDFGARTVASEPIHRTIAVADNTNGYTGGQDVELRASAPDVVPPFSFLARVDSADDAGQPTQFLIQFADLFGGAGGAAGPLDAASDVLHAELQFNFTDAGSGMAAHRLLVPWSETTATWNALNAGVTANGVEARAEPDQVIGTPNANPNVYTGLQSVDVTRALRGWLNGEPNHGWAFLPLPGGSNAVGFTPSEYPVPSLRPNLLVTVPTSPVRVATFRAGEGGYTGAGDTMLRQATPSTDYAEATSIFVDESDAGGRIQALVRFDGLFGENEGQVPADARVTSAMLELHAINGGSGLSVQRMLRTWAENSTWNGLGAGVSADDVEAERWVLDAAGAANASANVPAGRVLLDVTEAVQRWLVGEANQGLLLNTRTSGTDGIELASSEHPDPALRPRLIVRFTGGTAPCAADFNADTTPGDIFDLFDFLAALDGGLDFNGDTTPADIFDLFDFLAVLDAGCP